MYKLILFDLDGTLADTSEGIYGAYHYSCEQSGIVLSEDSLNGVIGGNLLRVFVERFGLNEQDAREAITIYRNWYEKNGIRQAKIYPGIEDVLDRLSKQYILGVATLKREDFAVKMLSMLKINQYFHLIHGMDKNDLLSKELIIRDCINAVNAAPSETLLIGDSVSDLRGARANNIDFLAVTYGFGFRNKNELTENGIIRMADKTEDIIKLLL